MIVNGMENNDKQTKGIQPKKDLMVFADLNITMIKKKKGITNQSRANKNLKDTKGISLVILVISIHTRSNNMAIVTGCFTM